MNTEKTKRPTPISAEDFDLVNCFITNRTDTDDDGEKAVWEAWQRIRASLVVGP